MKLTSCNKADKKISKQLHKNLGLSLLFLLFFLLVPLQQLHANENWLPISENQGINFRIDHYAKASQDTSFASLSAENQEFDLARYYDALEPPDQDGWLGRYTVLGDDATIFMVPALMSMGIIYMLPENVSNWDKEKITWQYGKDHWPKNATGWVWDNDALWINYIGHPYVGSSYYIYARHYGYSRMESFLFSFTASFFYETGIEAWAEPASIQDIIFTPLLGWGLAEILLPVEHSILNNNKRVLNSRILGGISLFLIDPFGHIVLPLKEWLKTLVSKDAEVQLSPMIEHYNQVSEDNGTNIAEQCYGIHLSIQW